MQSVQQLFRLDKFGFSEKKKQIISPIAKRDTEKAVTNPKKVWLMTGIGLNRKTWHQSSQIK